MLFDKVVNKILEGKNLRFHQRSRNQKIGLTDTSRALTHIFELGSANQARGFFGWVIFFLSPHTLGHTHTHSLKESKQKEKNKKTEKKTKLSKNENQEKEPSQENRGEWPLRGSQAKKARQFEVFFFKVTEKTQNKGLWNKQSLLFDHKSKTGE